MVTGLRTLLVGFLMAIGPTAMEYLGAVNWEAVIGPKWAFLISGAVMVGMRLVTKTPVGQKPE